LKIIQSSVKPYNDDDTARQFEQTHELHRSNPNVTGSSHNGILTIEESCNGRPLKSPHDTTAQRS
jgi:hypothetical protein